MMRFIYLSMFVVAMSFVAIPIYKNISDERQTMMQTAQAQGVVESEDISFEEIYAIADQGQEDAAALNEITPAAGADIKDEFSIGFRGAEDKALEQSNSAVDQTQVDQGAIVEPIVDLE